ncbi:hypothetical protein Patl1_04833 [Pistacia atlantica]|uniref:Uncharacterized protein n=1 Tax=Pistacia atlantica TaxID=434234 RepID=A0ACC1BP18_9ROSI|nr:hypothetical protein Patl1_04833 [Pistacia atlantica]
MSWCRTSAFVTRKMVK